MLNHPRVRQAGVVAVICGALLATLASAESADDSSSDNTETTAAGAEPTGDGSDTTISQGLGSTDASADVSAPTIEKSGEEPFTITEAKVTITNNSAEASDYFITIAAESPDGATRYEETVVSVLALEPGQSTEETGAFFDELPPDAVAVIKEVQRTSSV